jgi:hypothetical protein
LITPAVIRVTDWLYKLTSRICQYFIPAVISKGSWIFQECTHSSGNFHDILLCDGCDGAHSNSDWGLCHSIAIRIWETKRHIGKRDSVTGLLTYFSHPSKGGCNGSSKTATGKPGSGLIRKVRMVENIIGNSVIQSITAQ